jgi:hypothetical protein
MKRFSLFGMVVGLFLFVSGGFPALLCSAAESGDADSNALNGHSTDVKKAAVAPETNGANESSSKDIVYKPGGYGEFEVGQIASGFYKYPGQSIGPISHVWQQRALFWFGDTVLIKNKLEINLAGGGVVAFSTPQVGGQPQNMQTHLFFLFKSANAKYSFFNSDKVDLKLQVGYFPYKYSPNVRNLGEYLFRTNAYPLIVYSDFDYPMADLLGARFQFGYTGPDKTVNIKNDLLLHSELYSVPAQDWSLSDVVSATFLDAFTVGGGVSLCNWFSVYQGKYGADWADQYYYPDTSSSNAAIKRSFLLGNAAGDTALFDWKSTKVMVRFSADFRRFIPLDIFGKNDFQIYGEADFIGLKNYPVYFTDLKDRTFYTLGLNIPTCKVLDVANIEMEYCRDTSAFSDERLFSSATPGVQPVGLNDGNSLLYKVLRNQVRWSAYLKKTILDGHVSFIAQVARDHKKLNFYYFLVSKMSLMESMPTGSDWWWSFKTEFNF